MPTYSNSSFNIFGWSDELLASSQKITESMLEYNAAVMRGSEILSRRIFENYVTNVTESFEEMKTLNRSRDADSFIRQAARQSVSATERMVQQSRHIADLSGRLAMETGEAGILAYNKGVAAQTQLALKAVLFKRTTHFSVRPKVGLNNAAMGSFNRTDKRAG